MGIVVYISSATGAPALWGCSTCDRIWRQPGLAEHCNCKPSPCRCGAPRLPGRVSCRSCLDLAEADRQAKMVAKAKTVVSIDDYEGDQLFMGDEYHSADDVRDECAFDLPDYAWAVVEYPLSRFDAVGLLESKLEDYWEEAISMVDVDSLQAALDEWVDENRDVGSVIYDYTTAVDLRPLKRRWAAEMAEPDDDEQEGGAA